MLQLINALSQTADLNPDTVIPIERNIPLFNEENQPFADITYGFKLPLTPNNQEFIKNAHLVEAENKVYAQEVKLLTDGTPFHAGILTYKITDKDIDALFKINYGALAEKAKTVKLSEIYTGDALETEYSAAYMNQVCANPKSYPYSFFPVYNEAWNPNELNTEFVVNNWDHAAQTFNITQAKATCPYFKLKYLIKKVMEYLGFAIDGDYLKDPESEEIFVYSQIISSPYLNGCFTYLPEELTITDFLIKIKERFGISCNFDMITGKVNIINPASAINTSQIQDLSDYVTSVDEIAIPEAKGYSIVLMPDEGDELFLDETEGVAENTYSPTNRLVIGNKEKEIEIESSTLKVKTFETYSMPATKQELYFSTNKHEPFPLRFLRFKGMVPVAGGKVFPQAEPMELSLDDALWYKFLNESKTVKLKINIPAFLLAKLKIYQRISFLSKEGNHTIALMEKLSYNLSSGNNNYITATIQCRTMVNSYKTDAQIIAYKPELDPEDSELSGLIPVTFKALFDNKRLAKVNIEIRITSNRPNGRVSVSPYSISTSTDAFGIGGMVISPALSVANGYVLRVTSGVPKYAIVGGLKFYFTQNGDFYDLNLNTLSRSPYDVQGVWIIMDDSVILANPIGDNPPGGGTVNPPVLPPAPTTLREKFSFSIGSAIKKPVWDIRAGYRDLGIVQFDRWSPENEMKMGRIVKVDGNGNIYYDWTDPDWFMNTCKDNGKKAMIHCVIWANEIKDDVYAVLSAMTAQQRADWLTAYVTAYFERYVANPTYAGVAEMIDLINEPFDNAGNLKASKWKTLLPNFHIVALTAAQPYINMIKIGINDYDIEYENNRAAGIVTFRDAMLELGLVFHYIGSQMHSVVRMPIPAFRERLQILSNAGIMVHISELDVRLRQGMDEDPDTEEWSGATPTDLFNQRTDLQIMQKNFFVAVFKGSKECVAPAMNLGITTWSIGFKDNAWNTDGSFSDFPVLWDYEYNPTPAYHALMALPD